MQAFDLVSIEGEQIAELGLRHVGQCLRVTLEHDLGRELLEIARMVFFEDRPCLPLVPILGERGPGPRRSADARFGEGPAPAGESPHDSFQRVLDAHPARRPRALHVPLEVEGAHRGDPALDAPDHVGFLWI